MFLNCSSAFFGPAALGAVAADCAFAPPISIPQTMSSPAAARADASFFFIEPNLYRNVGNKPFTVDYCTRTCRKAPQPQISPAKAHPLAPFRAEAQIGIPERAQ